MLDMARATDSISALTKFKVTGAPLAGMSEPGVGTWAKAWPQVRPMTRPRVQAQALTGVNGKVFRMVLAQGNDRPRAIAPSHDVEKIGKLGFVVGIGARLACEAQMRCGPAARSLQLQAALHRM